MDHSFPWLEDALLLVLLLPLLLLDGEPIPSGCLVGVALKCT